MKVMGASRAGEQKENKAVRWQENKPAALPVQQHPGGSDKAFAAFKTYPAPGPQRRLAQVAEKAVEWSTTQEGGMSTSATWFYPGGRVATRSRRGLIRELQGA